MADMDNLLGSKISLISVQDVRYDGVLYSINQKESSIVLKDVRCLGTEDRVNDPAKKIPANSNSILFVSFPGADIKDLFVHEQGQPDVPPPAPGRDEAFHNPPQPPKTNTKPTPREQPNKAQAQPQQSNAKPPQNQNQENLPKPPVNAVQPQRQKAEQNNPGRGRGGRAITQQQSETNANANANGIRSKNNSSTNVGTGQHLLNLKVKKNSDGSDLVIGKEDFDFNAANTVFNKQEVLAKVAEEATVPAKVQAYKKDDFFDCLSNEQKDREEGRKTRLTAGEERNLNQDTFGAVALQPNRRYGGRGGRNNGRFGGGRGRGRGTNTGRGYGGRNSGQSQATM